MISPARQMAFEILKRVYETNAYASELLISYHRDGLSLEDRRLAYEIVLGVLRWQLQLDYFIEKYADRKIKRFDLSVLIALRLGLYQIRFLERVPDYAAVAESVALVKASGLTRAAGLVNAVLRKACRMKGDQPRARIRDKLQRLSIELSHPRWLVEKWIADFGPEEAIRLMQANNVSPPLVIRFNPLVGVEHEINQEFNRKGIKIEPSKYVPGAYRVIVGTLSPQSSLLTKGWIYVQDEASQLIAHLVAPEPGMRVLDLCAAPGGKTTHMAALMENSGMIVAGDQHHWRLRTLRAIASKLDVEIAHPVTLDGRGDLPFVPWLKFQRVLVDAPCSGTGTLRRNPEIKWRLTESQLSELSQTQSALLSQAAEWVDTDGLLVYTTCSLEREENEEVIERFLATQSHFEVVVPALAEELVSESGCVRTFPHRDGMDGFFVSILKKNKFARNRLTEKPACV